MSFTFTPEQIYEIDRLRLLPQDADGTRRTLYTYIFDQITNADGLPKEELSAEDRSTWLWLRGAYQANSNDGSFTSEFIRDYTGKPCERHAV